MAKVAQRKRTYRRDDGVVMVEVAPGQFVNERVASVLEERGGGLSRDSSLQASRSRRSQPEGAR
jgi:hypothetical protein